MTPLTPIQDDVPLILEELLLEADELSAQGAPVDSVDAVLLAALDLLDRSFRK